MTEYQHKPIIAVLLGLLVAGYILLILYLNILPFPESTRTLISDTIQNIPPGSYPEENTIGDLNGDGHLDRIIMRGATIIMFFNTGNRLFTHEVDYHLPEYPLIVRLEKNPLSNRLDLLVTNDVDNSQTRFRNDGNGKFTDLGTTPDRQWLEKG